MKELACWNYQQDNGPAHKLAISHISYWNSLHGCSFKLMSNWPPNSPVLYPIKNACGWMEAMVNALEYTTLREFNAAVHIICKEMAPAILYNVYRSKTKRRRLVREKGGGKTDYQVLSVGACPRTSLRF